MNLSNFGAVRHSLLSAAVLTLFAVPSGAQVVEKGRTLADLIQSHPCDTGLTNRIARVTDCDAADDIGDGGGAFQCWAICDGTAPWAAVSIGGGSGGSSGPATALQSPVVIEGTADAFEGNFTFADPTADWTWAWGATGTLTGPAGGGTIVGGTGASDTLTLDGSAGTAGTLTVTSTGRLNTAGFINGMRMYHQDSSTSPGIFISSGGVPAGANFVALGIGLYKTGLLFTDATNAENSHDSGLQRYASGVLATTDGTGLAYRHLMGGGAAVASATALPVPTGNGFHVTGTTNITSMTATNLLAGVVVTMIFDDVLTFTDGNNLKLAGNFVTTADDSISLYFDGTNFYEQSRSVN